MNQRGRRPGPARRAGLLSLLALPVLAFTTAAGVPQHPANLHRTVPTPAAPEASSPDGPGSGDVIPGHYIVTVKTGVSNQIRADARNLAADYGGRLGDVWTMALHGFSVQLSAADAGRLARDARVASVRPDLVVTPDGTQTGPTWNLDRIDQPRGPLSST